MEVNPTKLHIYFTFQPYVSHIWSKEQQQTQTSGLHSATLRLCSTLGFYHHWRSSWTNARDKSSRVQLDLSINIVDKSRGDLPPSTQTVESTHMLYEQVTLYLEIQSNGLMWTWGPELISLFPTLKSTFKRSWIFMPNYLFSKLGEPNSLLLCNYGTEKKNPLKAFSFP